MLTEEVKRCFSGDGSHPSSSGAGDYDGEVRPSRHRGDHAWRSGQQRGKDLSSSSRLNRQRIMPSDRIASQIRQHVPRHTSTSGDSGGIEQPSGSRYKAHRTQSRPVESGDNHEMNILEPDVDPSFYTAIRESRKTARRNEREQVNRAVAETLVLEEARQITSDDDHLAKALNASVSVQEPSRSRRKKAAPMESFTASAPSSSHPKTEPTLRASGADGTHFASPEPLHSASSSYRRQQPSGTHDALPRRSSLKKSPMADAQAGNPSKIRRGLSELRLSDLVSSAVPSTNVDDEPADDDSIAGQVGVRTRSKDFTATIAERRARRKAQENAREGAAYAVDGIEEEELPSKRQKESDCAQRNRDARSDSRR